MHNLSPKQRAALQAAQVVCSGSRIGLGSGSTVNLIIAALGKRQRRGELHDLQVVVASRWTAAAAHEAALMITTLERTPRLDLAIDGADEVDPRLPMIKGGGGALLRKRVVLAAAAERLIVVDDGKLVPVFDASWAVPVEVVQFGWRVSEVALRALGAEVRLHMEARCPSSPTRKLYS